MTTPALPASRTCLVCRTPLAAALDGHAARVCRKSECQWTFRTTPKHRACTVCGRPLSTREVEVCADAECQRVRAQTLHRARRETMVALQAAQVGRAAALRDAEAPALGVVDPGQYLPTPIPRTLRRLSPLPGSRRALLRDHIAELIAAALRGDRDTSRLVSSRPSPGSPGSPGSPEAARAVDPVDEMSPELAAVLGKSCTRCQGYCCEYGGNHAYLRVDAIARYMAAHPERSPAEVLEDYVSRVGEHTFDGSCTYHGPEGCTLPRAMRSEICNTFYCFGLMELRKAVRAGAAPRAFVFTEDADGGVRAAFLDAREVRVVHRRAPRTPASAPSE